MFLQIVDEWFGRSIIRSCAKLSYGHAQVSNYIVLFEGHGFLYHSCVHVGMEFLGVAVWLCSQSLLLLSTYPSCV